MGKPRQRLDTEHVGIAWQIQPSTAYGYVATDAVISYETYHHVLLQLRGGVSGYFGHRGADDMSSNFDLVPFGSLGLGFKF